ncbi:MAG TPA: hypothetical protein PKY82_02335 [Pyrinomonadaceae bacterium]|nr:hypothetical protein [Pyrinomonadaceae bacterium]
MTQIVENITDADLDERGQQKTSSAPLYTDPASAKVAFSLVWIIFFCLALIGTLIGLCIFLYLRKPDRIVIEKNANGEQVLLVNDRSFGDIKGLTIEPDRPTNAQKMLLAKDFAGLLFEVDLSTRQKAIKKALGMMPNASAQTLFQYLKQNTSNAKNDAGVALTVEKTENWAAIFEIKDASLDSNNPNLINLIGTQKITKVIGGTPSEEERDLQLQLKVHPDANGRQDYNEQLGFQVISYTMKELPK